MAQDIADVDALAKKTIALLRERIPVIRAYLFGSHVDGSADDHSDIDIAAFSPGIEVMPLEARVDLIVKLEKQMNASIDIHLFSEKNLAEARPTNFFGYLRTHGKLIE